MLLTCRSTVRSLIPRSAAIARFDLPRATSRKTSTSRADAARPAGASRRRRRAGGVGRGAERRSAARAASSSIAADSASPRSRQRQPDILPDPRQVVRRVKLLPRPARRTGERRRGSPSANRPRPPHSRRSPRGAARPRALEAGQAVRGVARRLEVVAGERDLTRARAAAPGSDRSWTGRRPPEIAIAAAARPCASRRSARPGSGRRPQPAASR